MSKVQGFYCLILFYAVLCLSLYFFAYGQLSASPNVKVATFYVLNKITGSRTILIFPENSYATFESLEMHLEKCESKINNKNSSFPAALIKLKENNGVALKKEKWKWEGWVYKDLIESYSFSHPIYNIVFKGCE